MRRVAAITLALVATSAMAADNISAGARLAASCAGCHGTNGSTQGGLLTPLAGQKKADLLEKMNGFKAGTRPATVMTQISKGYTDEQLETLAAYYAAQRAGERK